MNLNRSAIRQMILNEIRILSESEGGYDDLSAEDKLYAQVGHVDQLIQAVTDLKKRADYASLFLSDCQEIEAAIDGGKSWVPSRKGAKNAFDRAIESLKKNTASVDDMLRRGKEVMGTD